MDLCGILRVAPFVTQKRVHPCGDCTRCPFCQRLFQGRRSRVAGDLEGLGRRTPAVLRMLAGKARMDSELK